MVWFRLEECENIRLKCSKEARKKNVDLVLNKDFSSILLICIVHLQNISKSGCVEADSSY